jgi:hypothetical protein
VSVVDIRHRLVDVEITVPSERPADDFTIRVTFRCRVTKAEAVASRGVLDIMPTLQNYLLADRELSRIGSAHRVEEVNQARERANARLTAYHSVMPLHEDGMEIELGNIQVLTPEDLRTWGRRLRDEEWLQQIEELKRSGEDDDVRRIADLLKQGPLYADAIGLSRQQVEPSAVAERLHTIHQSDIARQAELILELVKQGHSSGTYIDLQQIIQQALGGDGSHIAALDPKIAPAVEAADTSATDSSAQRPSPQQKDGGREGFVLDEDDLLG